MACNELLFCADVRMRQAVNCVKDAAALCLRNQGVTFSTTDIADQVDIVDPDSSKPEASVSVLELTLSVGVCALVVSEGGKIDPLCTDGIDDRL